MGPGVLTDHVTGIVCVFDASDGLGGIDAIVIVSVEEECAFCAGSVEGV